MGTTMNRATYEELIADDLAWLAKQPETLERLHIEIILRHSASRLYDDARVVARPDLLRQVLEAHDSCDQTRIIEAMDAVRDAVYPAIASASNVAQHPNVKDIRDFAAAVNSDRVATLKHALRVVVERLDALVSAPTPKSATQRERVLHGLLVEAKGHLEGRKMSQLSHSPQALIAIINALPAPDVSPPVVARHPNDSLRASTNSGQAANVDGASHCAHDWISGARLTYCRLCGADAPAANIPTLKARVLSMLHEGRSMYPGCGVAIDAIISRTTHLFDRAALEVKPKMDMQDLLDREQDFANYYYGAWVKIACLLDRIRQIADFPSDGSTDHAAALGRLESIYKIAVAPPEPRAPSRLERAAIAFIDAERTRLRTAATFLETGEAEDDGAWSKAIDAADDARIELDEARDDEALRAVESEERMR